MANALSATISVVINALLQEPAGVGPSQHQLALSPNNVLSDGIGAGQAKQMYTATRTLAASGTENLDLTGTLVNALGAVLNFTKIKAILITADAANVNNVQVGGAASNGFANWVTAPASAIVNVPPGGMFLLTAPDANGFGVTATTGDLLKVTNGGAGTPVTYTIVVIGVV